MGNKIKIGFYDSDPAGGITPMIIKLKEENIPFEKVDSTLNLIKNLDLVIIDYTALPHLPKNILNSSCDNLKKMVESNVNTKFLIMVPGAEWWVPRMNKMLGIHKNIDYVTGGDTSKLTSLLETNKK